MSKNLQRKSSKKEQWSSRTGKRNREENSAQIKQFAESISSFESSPLDLRSEADLLQLKEETPHIRSVTQSGDLQGIAVNAAASQSIAELLGEGQDLEGELVQGIERARDADQGEIRTHEASRKEVPSYTDRNRI